MTLSDLAKYSVTRSVAQSLCDSRVRNRTEFHFSAHPLSEQLYAEDQKVQMTQSLLLQHISCSSCNKRIHVIRPATQKAQRSLFHFLQTNITRRTWPSGGKVCYRQYTLSLPSVQQSVSTQAVVRGKRQKCR